MCTYCTRARGENLIIVLYKRKSTIYRQYRLYSTCYSSGIAARRCVDGNTQCTHINLHQYQEQLVSVTFYKAVCARADFRIVSHASATRSARVLFIFSYAPRACSAMASATIIRKMSRCAGKCRSTYDLAQ